MAERIAPVSLPAGAATYWGDEEQRLYYCEGIFIIFI